MTKQLLAGIVVLLMAVGIGMAEAAQTYVLSIQNEAVSGTDFSFDIFIRRTADPIDFGDSDVSLQFNNGNFTNPGATVVGSLAGYVMGAQILPGSPVKLIVNITAPAASPFAVPTIDTKVATVTISNISNPTGTRGLIWVTGAQTIVQTYMGDDITGLGTYQNPLIDLPLPITLASFAAKINPSGPGVKLEWRTMSEVNNYGFYVQRRLASDSLFTEIENSFVAGHGTTLEPQQYTYVDNTLTNVGDYYYRLRQVDLDGTKHFTSGTSVNINVSLLSVMEVAPIEFRLNQNYPNPFNPSTEIKFSVEVTGRAVVKIYNISGQEVATLFDDMAEAGQYYRLRLDGKGLATGVYFYRLQSGKKSDLKKMLLLK